jgi:2-C-methyl-D-erythritol 2,4-cyclodiphosphate synthase
MQMRVGVGWDSHRLVEGRPLIIGGVEIPFDRGLFGHSDGDVLLHAIGDALCGAAGLPDIGRLFPDTDAQWKNADSRQLLRGIAERVHQAGWQLANIDAVLIAERPKISPHIDAMRTQIARSLEPLQADVSQINVRGKTAERMDAVGQGQGMVAHAVCLLVGST